MPLVKFFLIILAPVAVPLAKVLDYFLEEGGAGCGTYKERDDALLETTREARRSGQRVRFRDARSSEMKEKESER